MRLLFIGLIGISVLMFSCTDNYDPILIENASITSTSELEEQLNSESIVPEGKSYLPESFLPIDTTLKLYKSAGYIRSSYKSLPMSMRAYSDSLGNEIIIYEWDLVTSELSEAEANKIKMDFEAQHDQYVPKYNSLINDISQQIGEPFRIGKNLEQSSLEAYKKWTTATFWKSEKQVVELRLLLVPHQIYRIILKNMILNESPKNIKLRS